MSDFETLI